MAKMSDEVYEFVQDTREKSITARSARHTRTHCGKGGAVKFPSDHLSAKELKNMNGKCRSYRMNNPVTWSEFKTWPDEHKITYIKVLRQKYGVPDGNIAMMMGCSRPTLCKLINELGLGKGRGVDTGRAWDRDGFFAWCSGAKTASGKVSETPVEEADVIQNETPVEETDVIQNETPVEEADVIQNETPVEEENVIPVEAPVKEDDIAESLFKPVEDDTCSSKPTYLVPTNGNMLFEGRVDDILRTIGRLLNGKHVQLNVKWDVLED